MPRDTKSKATLYDLLDRIRKDPRQYLQRWTLTSLDDFLLGFSVAQHGAVHGNFSTQDEPPFDDFAVWFPLHHGSQAPGYSSVIKPESHNTRAAFDRFFEYLTAFRTRKLKFRCSFALSSAQRKHCSAVLKMPAPKKLRLSRYEAERCVFVHACWKIRHGWQHHAGFKSMAQCRRWLARAYGVTPLQWRRIAHRA
jgi:hypothetical protein